VVGSRVAAWLLELLLFVVIMSFLGPTPLSPLAEYVEVPAGIDRSEACERLGDIEEVGGCLQINDRVYFTDKTDAAVQGIVGLLYFILVYVLWQGTKGLTPGKAVLGLRTVDENGQSPGIAKAFVRSVLWIIDGCLIGLIVAITTTGHRRVGDMAAKTYVVGKADAGRPIIVPGATPAAGAYGVQPGYGSGGYPQQPGAGGWGAQPPAAPGTAWGAGAPSSGQGYPQAAPTGPPTAPPTAPGGPYYGAPAAPAAYPAPGAAPATGEYTAVPTGPTTPAAPAAPAAAPAPPASAFDESSDPADSDGPADEIVASSTEASTSVSDDEAPKADEPSSGETPAVEAASSESDTGSIDADDSPVPAAPEPAPAPTAPADEPSTAAAPPTATAAASGVEQAYNPQWDAARGAYIQWDPNRSRWLQWDDTAKEWKPI
jgi:hypothetical protein